MIEQLKEVQIYGEFDAKIAEVKDACNFIPDVSTDEGYAKSKRVSLDVGKILTAVEAKRVEEKKESLAYGKKVDSEAKTLVAKLQAFQLPHKEAYKELDNLRKEREANRKAELERRVEEIRSLPEAMADSDSQGCKMALESLNAEECLDFYEFTEPALKARNASKEALAKMFSDKLKAEKDVAELAELRKKQAEQEQKDHDERIAKEASEKAEREAAEAKAAEQAAIEQAAEAVRQRETAEKRAANDAKLAEERRIEVERVAKIDAEQAEKRRIEAEAKSKKNAEEAAERARKALIEQQEAEKAAELAEQEKRESNKRHIGTIRKQAKDSFMVLGFTEADSKKLVMAIHDGKISNVTISY